MRAYFSQLLGSSRQQKQLPFIFPLLISLCSGAIFSLALAPYYYWWIAILSPALLYAVLHGRTAKQGFALGWAYGFGLWFVGAFWLYTSIHVYGDTNAALSVLMIAVMALVMGLFTAVQTWLYRRFFPETPSPSLRSGLYLNGQRLGYLPAFHGYLQATPLPSVISITMRPSLVYLGCRLW